MDKDTAFKKISELVERFDDQYQSYKDINYNETQTRRDFIDPFFKALGWDIDNEQGHAEAYREVIHEDKVKVDGKKKAPDYSFRLVGGKRLFFVEAKKPYISVKDDTDPAYQLRRYGWSAKLPISILTDFEEFSVYDCTKRPSKSDNASVARIRYITYKDYLKEFDFIWGTFSKERVLKGSFDKFVQSDTLKKGTATVDKEFLQSLDNWRTYLANSVSWNNKNLDEDEINFVVQQTIDRIIFLRITEDRNIEPYGNLKHAISQGNYYQNLFQLFRQADEKYNSGLFDFKKDQLSEQLIIDNKVIKSIINELYYPDCPFEFSVLPVEILGSAYEQFLGKVIRITPARHAKIDLKPEVRKAGGVYYTPQYIVDYIIENTVGKLIEGKTPVEVSSIKIVDPACGSGSFLLGAYQYMLDWHKNYYNQNIKPGKSKKESPLTPDGNLTTAEKKRILLNNIFGVDIDVNAVEVTKLSLLLKCMEGETSASIAYQLALFNERVLPSLENNIKSGNSLIDTDFYDNQFDFGIEKKIKPFNWQRSFPEIFKQGGFDTVIGNPPYVRSKLLEEPQRQYFSNKYKSTQGTFDIYTVFMEQAFNLVRNGGLVAFINPNKYFYSDYGEGIRNLISKNYCVLKIVDFNEYQVFEGITTYTTVNIFSKGELTTRFTYDKIIDKRIDKSEVEDALLKGHENANIIRTKIEGKNLHLPVWLFKSEEQSIFIQRIINEAIPLKDLCYKIYQGFVLTPTEVFPVSVEEDYGSYVKIKPIKNDKTIYEVEKELIVPIVKSSNIKRYYYENMNYYSVFPYKYINNYKVELISEDELKRKFPRGYQYLKIKSNYLKTREKGKWNNSPTWYEYSRKQNFECQKMAKILVPGLAKNARYTFANNDVFIDQGSYGIILKEHYQDFGKLILGLLNSKLIDYIFQSSSGTLSGGYYSYQTKYLNELPILLPKGEESLKAAKLIEQYVDNINDTIKQLLSTQLHTSIEQLQAKLNFLEGKIDEIVYQLYNLTKEEISIIEQAMN